MPQSQLWFIDHKLSSQSTTNRKNQKEANMFPAVAKVAGQTASEGFSHVNIKAGSSRPAILMNEGQAPNSNEPIARTRNIFLRQQESLASSMHTAASNINSRTQSNFMPLNSGKNRGQFNQLRNLLQTQERVQTCEEPRNKKHVLFDQSRKMDDAIPGFHQSTFRGGRNKLASTLISNDDLVSKSLSINQKNYNTS